MARCAEVENSVDVAEEISIDFVSKDRIVGRVIEWANGEIALTTYLTMTRST